MPAIDQDVIDEFFTDVQRARDVLPVLENAAAAVNPALASLVEAIRFGQTAMFELLSRLQSASDVALDAEKAKLRDETVAAWRAGRG